MGCTYVKEFKFGGAVKAPTPSRRQTEKHDKLETPTTRREELLQRVQVKGVPVAPREPIIPAMKKGGLAHPAKVGKVMNEFGKGELHSGSKSGPTVTNPKQAVAIALSEARKK